MNILMNKLPREIQDMIIEYCNLDECVVYNDYRIINKKLLYCTWYSILLESNCNTINYLINNNFDTDTLEYIKRNASTQYLEHCIINKQPIIKLNLLNSLFSYGSISCEIYTHASSVYKNWIDNHYPYTFYDHKLIIINPKSLKRVNYL